MSSLERPLPSRIVLVGYRASGKSTLGTLLASRLGQAFLDLDRRIEEVHHRSIASFFENEGEEHFRDLESNQLDAEMVSFEGVLATGGGVVLRRSNRELLASRGWVVVYLRVPADELIRRLGHGESRPALTDLSLGDEVRQLLREREPLYCDVADRVLEVDAEEAPEQTVARLIGLLQDRSPSPPADE